MKSAELLIFSGLIVSALFISYFFLFKGIGRGGRKYIITGMFFAFFIFLYDLLFHLEEWAIAIWIYILYFPIIFGIYPLIYHYLVYAANDRNQRYIVKLFTFFPIIILVANLIIYLPLSYEEKISFINTDILLITYSNDYFFFYQTIIFSFYYIQLIIFIGIFVNLYLIHKKRKTDIEQTQKLYLPAWLFLIVSIVIMYELVFVMLLVFDIDTHAKVIEQSSNLAFLVLLGFVGIKHDEMLIKMKLSKISQQSTYTKKQKNINADETERIMKIVDEIINAQSLYKMPGIKLEHIAKKIHLPNKKLSIVINQSTGNDFSYYINKLRIEEAKRILQERKNYEKIEDVYLYLGYYTRSTFNRAFKTIEGITPTEYLKSHT